MIIRIRSLVLAFASFATACDGSGSGSVSIDNLGPELAKAYCARTFKCCDATEVMDEFDGLTVGGQPITTEQQCVTAYTGILVQLAIPGYKMSIAAGRAGYDGQAAGACIGIVNDLACTEGTGDEFETACEPYVVPMVADGAACSQDYECTSGNCDTSAATGADGTCMPVPGIGMACSGDCVDGAYCDYGAASPTCAATLANGMACDDDETCTSGHCTGDFSTPGTCEDDMTCNGV